MSTDTERSLQQTRTPRADGKRHMVEAAIHLLRERPAEQISIRDIAEESGHHHRFVQSWFGGKVALMRAAFEQLTEDAADGLEAPLDRGQFSEDVRISTSLMNWLVAADPHALDGPRPTPIIDRITEIYVTSCSLKPDLARLMALRVVAGSISALLFPDSLGLNDGDLPALARLEAKLADLLARDEAG